MNKWYNRIELLYDVRKRKSDIYLYDKVYFYIFLYIYIYIFIYLFKIIVSGKTHEKKKHN